MVVSASLPLDVFIAILDALPPSRYSNASVRALTAFQTCNSLLQEAANSSGLWKAHYQARYTVSDSEKESFRVNDHGDDWRARYAIRRRIDNEALVLLDRSVADRRVRLEATHFLLERYSMDVWDVLEVASQLPTGLRFDLGSEEFNDLPDEEQKHALTRAYWARNFLEMISRQNALLIWSDIKRDGPIMPTFAQALCAFSVYLGESPAKLDETFKTLGDRCKAYIISEGSCLEAEHAEYDPVKIARGIGKFMKQEGFKGASAGEFHRIENSLPHCFLSSHKGTIPLSLVCVFVDIANRIGLHASPVNFPGRVLARVMPALGDHFFFDAFEPDGENILSLQSDIPRRLALSGFTDNREVFTAACDNADMLLRASQNIVSSYRIPNPLTESTVFRETVAQTALAFMFIFTQDIGLILSMFQLEAGPHPLHRAVFASMLLPFTSRADCKSKLRARMSEHTAIEVTDADIIHRRTSKIRFFVGMVFEHVLHGYRGCIIGWQPQCNASEEWMQQMSVDKLSKGRNQPFYNSLVSSAGSTYVAEENIRPIDLTTTIAKEFITSQKTFGLYFDNMELNESTHGHGRLLLSPEMARAYPEDVEASRQWVAEDGNDIR